MANPENVQRLIPSAYAQPVRVTLMFRIDAPARARAFLGQWLEYTRAEGDGPPASGPILHFAFSWSGLARLLEDEGSLDTDEGRRQMELFFTDPTQAVDGPALASQLGFVESSAPEHWWSGEFDTASIEMVVFGFFDTADQKSQCLDRLRTSAAGSGLTELVLPGMEDHALSGTLPPGGRVHFGYRDGVSQHVIDWNDEAAPGMVNFREFFVGYPRDEYKVPPVNPGPWQDFARDGSFLGLTWLYQDVAAFNRFLRDNAAHASPHAGPADTEEWIAAKIMGRWRDGSSLVRHPDRMPSAPSLDNDFGYADDKRGLKCPLTSHIRVTNLRDQEMTFPNRRRFRNGPPKLIRRGFSYGPPLEGVEDDGVDRGLVGIFACARLNEQFYTVLRWMQKTGFSKDFRQIPGGQKAQDSLTGNRMKPGALTAAHIPVSDNASLALGLTDFIRFKGVAALFAPSMHALAVLAADP